MDEIMQESKIKSQNSQILEKSTKSELPKKIFLSLIHLFSKHSETQIKPNLQYFKFFVVQVIVFFQYTSLLWHEEMGFLAWSEFKWYWKILGYFRIDNIFKDLGQKNSMLFGFSAVEYTGLALSGYFLFCSIMKKHQMSFFNWILKKNLNLKSCFLFFPFCIVFLTGVLDNFRGVAGGGGIYLALNLVNCAVCFVFHIFGKVVVIFFDCDVNHGVRDKEMLGKSTCMIDVKSTAVDLFLVLLYCLLPFDRIQVIHIFAFILKFWLSANYLIYIPFFNRLSNQLIFCRIAAESILALLFVSNYFINDSEFLLLSSLLIIPLTTFSTFSLMHLRYSKIDSKLKTLNISLFEIKIRQNLCNVQTPDRKLILKFNKLQKKDFLLTGNKSLLSIWLSYYCINSLKDYRLAFIKLSQANKVSFSIEAYILELKLRKFLKSKYLNQLEDLFFLEYILKLNNAKDLDEHICEIYIDFSTEITSKNPSKSKLKRLAHDLDSKLKKVQKSYLNLCEKYPNGVEAFRLYKSFLNEIRVKAEGGLKIKGLDVHDFKEFNYFDDSNGIMLVSGELEDLGKIIYANSGFAMMMRTSTCSLIGSDLNSLIPYPFNIGHNNTLIRYSQFCNNSQLRFPGSLFLKTEKGFLVEFNLKITCVSSNHCIFYLVVAKEIENQQICVLLSHSGLIYSYSENFLPLFPSSLSLENHSIEEIIPGLKFCSLPINNPVNFKIESESLHMIKSKRVIAGIEMNLIYIVKTQSALNQVMKQALHDTVEVNEVNVPVRRVSNLEIETKSKVKFLNSMKENKTDFVSGEESHGLKKGYTEDIKVEKDNSRLKQMKLRRLEVDLFRSMKCMKKIKIVFIGFVFLLLVTSAVNLAFFKKRVDYFGENSLRDLFLDYINLIQSVCISVEYVESAESEVLAGENIKTLNLLYGNSSSLNEDIYKYTDHYNDCPYFPVSFSENSIYFYEDDEISFKSKLNLFETIKLFRYYTFVYISSLDSDKTSNNASFILKQNGGHYLYNQAMIDLRLIDLCHNYQNLLFEKYESIITICQICLIIVFVVLELFLISTFIKTSNQFWTTISQNAYDSYFEIRNICCERLRSHLQVREDEVQVYFEMIRTSRNIFHIGIGQILGYSWRILIILILSILYISVFANILVPKLNDLTRNKDELIDSIYIRKFQMQRIEFLSFSNEKNQLKINEAIEDYGDLRKYAMFNRFDGIMEQKVFTYIFDNAGSAGSLKFGWNSAGDLLLTDYYFWDKSNIIELRSKSLDFYTKADEIIKEINKVAVEKFDYLYTITLVTVCSFAFMWIFLYLFLYQPYLNRKVKTVQSFLNIFKFFILVENTATTSLVNKVM